MEKQRKQLPRDRWQKMMLLVLCCLFLSGLVVALTVPVSVSFTEIPYEAFMEQSTFSDRELRLYHAIKDVVTGEVEAQIEHLSEKLKKNTKVTYGTIYLEEADYLLGPDTVRAVLPCAYSQTLDLAAAGRSDWRFTLDYLSFFWRGEQAQVSHLPPQEPVTLTVECDKKSVVHILDTNTPYHFFITHPVEPKERKDGGVGYVAACTASTNTTKNPNELCQAKVTWTGELLLRRGLFFSRRIPIELTCISIYLNNA